jgi:ABC-type branched-subunit amino acid transport system ATPase component
MASILESQRITKRFGGLTAVGQLDVAVEPNTIHSIIGPNGAGKTTFFNCITGFYRPDQRHRDSRRISRSIGMQQPSHRPARGWCAPSRTCGCSRP